MISVKSSECNKRVTVVQNTEDAIFNFGWEQLEEIS